MAANVLILTLFGNMLFFHKCNRCNGMARSKTFDPDEVLEAALQLFWTKGYEKTSVQDLVDTMGINRGSLYDTFGDKRQLYLSVVDRYVAWYSISGMRAAMAGNGKSPKQQLTLLFDRLVEEGQGLNRKRGCLLTNTITELGHRDPLITEQVVDAMTRVEDTLTDLVRKGQELGEFSSHEDARSLARYLINAVNGMRVLMRVYDSRDPLADIARVTLSRLNPKANLH